MASLTLPGLFDADDEIGSNLELHIPFKPPSAPTTIWAKKQCLNCHQTFPRHWFSKSNNSPDKRSHWCPKCFTAMTEFERDAQSARHKRKTQAKYQRHMRRAAVKIYGIDITDYERMLDEQGGVCAICKKPEATTRKGKTRHLAVDHCHKTGKVRGLLCVHCNSALGHLRESPALFKAAANYIRLHSPET